MLKNKTVMKIDDLMKSNPRSEGALCLVNEVMRDLLQDREYAGRFFATLVDLMPVACAGHIIECMKEATDYRRT